MAYLRKRKKFNNHLHCVFSGKNNMFSVEFVFVVSLYLYLHAELSLWYMVKKWVGKWNNLNTLKGEVREKPGGSIDCTKVVEKVKRSMRQQKLSGILRYSGTGGNEKHKHLYSWIPSTFSLFLAHRSLLYISSKLLNITEFNELIRMRFTNRICAWVKFLKCNTDLLC